MSKAVIFDLDGTLLDTLEQIEDVVNRVLAEEGFRIHDRETYRLQVGRGLEYLLERLIESELSGSEMQEAVQRLAPVVRRRYLEAEDRITHPYDGIPEVLEELRELGIPASVLTNKPTEAALAAIRRFFGDYPFATVQGAEPGMPPKPAPDAALRIAQQVFGCSPEAVAFVGDTAVDMKTAVGAGMLPIGVLWGFRERDELRASGALQIVEHPSEIPPLLRSGNQGT